MSYKSEKQRRYMNWAASEGKIKKSIVKEFNRKSKGLDLPDHVQKAKRDALKRLRSK